VRDVVLDIECDHLDPKEVKNLWVIVCKDISTEEVFVFRGATDEFKTFIASCDHIVGHNAIDYDYTVLDTFCPGCIDPTKVIDTLVLSRLLKFKPDDGEGHSLEAWGNRFSKQELASGKAASFLKHASPDWKVFSEAIVERCIQDVEINYQLYLYLYSHMSEDHWQTAIQTEMEFAWICKEMTTNGFRYNYTDAEILLKSLEQRLQHLDTDIIACFPPRLKAVREITPKLTKHGTISKSNLPRDWTDLTRVYPGCPFTLVNSIVFNPGSTRQLVERLDEAGWKPLDRTKTGKGWKINETNLSTLPKDAPEGARKLVERALIAARVRTLTEWKAFYNSNTERIHGRFSSIGTWPGRMAHRQPNLGNVATRKSIKYKGEYLKDIAMDLGGRMRSLWTCDPDSWLVGTDMEAAHVRLFAHYIDDPVFTKAVVSGNKKDGTDVHTVGAQIFKHLNCDRDNHKTFIFSFFNGAGPPKVAEIFGCSIGEARKALDLYAKRFPGIRRLREELIPVYAKQGWFPGLDGRRVIYTEEHGMFAGMLQAGEACVMKMANIIWRRELNGKGITFREVNLVHDEFVTEIRGDVEIAKAVGHIQSAAITAVGERLRLKCPLTGEYKIGKNWLDVH
jgi:DNA polymerase-1